MAGKLTPITQGDFSGGLNLAANPFNLSRKQVWRLNNMFLDEHGALRTRPGVTTLGTSPLAGDGLYLNALNKVDGSSKRFAILRVGAVNHLYDQSLTPWQFVGAFTTGYNTPDSIQMLDKAILAPGYELPQTWNGTTFTPITAIGGQTVPPGAKHLIFHLGSLWLWNTNGTTTSLDGPSSLRMAATNSVDDWPNANQSFISKDDGQVGMGMASFTIVETGISPVSTLVLFKNYSAYQVTGVFGSSNFAIQKIKSDLGCIAPRTIQFVSGFGIVRLTHKGFALFDGVNDKLISEEIRPGIFGDTTGEFTSLDFTNTDLSWAGQVQNPPLYVAACPVAGTSGLSRIFIFDLVRKSWSFATVPYTLKCISTVTIPNQVQLEGLTAGPSKHLRLFTLADLTDDGTDVTWLFRTKPAFIGSPTHPTYWDSVMFDYVYTPPETPSTVLTLHSYNTTLTDSTPLPFFRTEGIRTININRVTSAVYAEITGTGPIKVRSLSWLGKPKPPTSLWRSI